MAGRPMGSVESSHLSWFERRQQQQQSELARMPAPCRMIEPQPEPESQVQSARAAAGSAAPGVRGGYVGGQRADPQEIHSELHVEGVVRLQLTQVVGATAEAGGADSWNTQEDLTGGLLWETCAVTACRCLAGSAVLTPLDPQLLQWDDADLPPMPAAADGLALTAAFQAKSRVVVELGAGTGAVGIAAAVLGARAVVLTDLPQHCGNIARNCRANNLVVQDAWQTGVQSSDSPPTNEGQPALESGSETAVQSATASASCAQHSSCGTVGSSSHSAYGPVFVKPHTWGEGVDNLSVGDESHRQCDIVILSELLHWPGTLLLMLYALDCLVFSTDPACVYANAALDCFSEDTLEPLARSVVGLLSSGVRAGESTGKYGIALVVYKSRLPAREAAFFSTCKAIGLDVCGPFGDDSPSATRGSDNSTSTTIAGNGAGRALVFSLKRAAVVDGKPPVQN